MDGADGGANRSCRSVTTAWRSVGGCEVGTLATVVQVHSAFSANQPVVTPHLTQVYLAFSRVREVALPLLLYLGTPSATGALGG